MCKEYYNCLHVLLYFCSLRDAYPFSMYASLNQVCDAHIFLLFSGVIFTNCDDYIISVHVYVLLPEGIRI